MIDGSTGYSDRKVKKEKTNFLRNIFMISTIVTGQSIKSVILYFSSLRSSHANQLYFSSQLSTNVRAKTPFDGTNKLPVHFPFAFCVSTTCLSSTAPIISVSRAA